MRPVLLIDFGSTFTKVTAVDLDEEILLGHASAFTTVDHDIGCGLASAIKKLEQKTGVLSYEYRLACSSAAGGLRMMVSGLVPELTAEAGRLAALGAGAKITRIFSHRLGRRDLAHIESNPPDIFLLTGGTDGGNRSVIIDNAAALARLSIRFPVIVAGNRDAVDDCEDLLNDFEVSFCPNVMPRFNKLNVEPVQRAIRSLFLTHIIRARGMTKASSLL
ncbi:MAG: MutL protein, partial [Clostridiaceae bacterium]|nr:MutL protein [Clostridiaceae bacterium]